MPGSAGGSVAEANFELPIMRAAASFFTALRFFAAELATVVCSGKAVGITVIGAVGNDIVVFALLPAMCARLELFTTLRT